MYFFHEIVTYKYYLEIHVLFDIICGFKDFPFLLKHADGTIVFQIVLKYLYNTRSWSHLLANGINELSTHGQLVFHQ